MRCSDFRPQFGPYLVVVRQRELVGWSLDRSTASLLERLREPMSYRELAAQLDDARTRERLPFELIALVQRGALVAAAAPSNFNSDLTRRPD
jgi:hypothetical protein